MYKLPQQRSPSRIPTTAPKASHNQHATGSFRVQPPLENSQTPPETQKYSPELADLLAAKMSSTTRQPAAQALPIQTKLTVGAPGDKYEQEADSMASKVMSMADGVVQRQTALGTQIQPQVQARFVQRAPDRSVPAGGNIENQLNSSQGGGSPLSEPIRAYMEPRFGADFSSVRVHTGEQAVQMNRELGAQAFTHGHNIYYGAGKSPGVNELTAHELTHVVQQSGNIQTKAVPYHSPRISYDTLPSQPSISSVDLAAKNGVIQLRPATVLERRAWLSFFSHYLPRKFLNNYMDDTGAPITLNQQEMIDCNPIVNLRRSQAFLREVATLQTAGGGSKQISVSGWGGALTNGTLGNFTIHYEGELKVDRSGNWSFKGTMHFYDYWDFDPKGANSGRPSFAELKVRVAAAALPGKPFHINSIKVPIGQTSSNERATWAGGTPSYVGDNAFRTGADMAAGEVAGGAVGARGGLKGAIGGAAVGAEVGAQSSEDLNQ